MSADPDFRLEVIFSPSRYFGWQGGSVRRGGYSVALKGCPEVGGEITLEGALDQLALLLYYWIESGYYDDSWEWVELDRGRLGRLVEQAIADDTLRARLGAEAARTEVVVDTRDDPLPDLGDEPDGILAPTMFGWLGDGELQIEVCPSAPTAGWALAWARYAEQNPADWRVVGRVWATYNRFDGGGWDIRDRGTPEALEFWQLEQTSA